MEKMRPADLAAGDRDARVLDQRVAAVVERDGVDDAREGRLFDERLGIGHGRRQRLVADDMLAARDRGGNDWLVQVIRRRDVHDVRRPGRRADPRSSRSLSAR